MSYKSEEQLSQLRDVTTHGLKGTFRTFGVLGNHDYGKKWSEQPVADEITSILEDSGVKILGNTQRESERLNIIGFENFWALNFAPYKVMRDYDVDKANIILCHNPDVCDLNVWKDHKGWILSGHTHGGQCKPPFLDPPIVPVKNENYSAGKVNLKDGRTVYVNRALGHIMQVRFNVRPEITVFVLDREEDRLV